MRPLFISPRWRRAGEVSDLVSARAGWYGMTATGDLSWCGLRRLFIVHHKAGTIFMERSSELLNRELQRLCRHHTMAMPIEVLDCGEEECDDTAVAGACSLHLERNPFEVVVSGYLYHRSNAEPDWEKEPMDAASWNDTEAEWAWKYHRALQRTIVDERYDALPRPSAHEGYAHFLQRIDETQGLQAEARFASSLTIDEMVTLHQRAMSHSASSPKHTCSAVACFSEFEGDVAACVSTWSQRLLALQFPAGVAQKLARVASSQCPGSHTGRQAAASHSATGTVSTPLHTLVARLAAYDLTHEGSKLAAADRMLGCPLGGKYLGPPSPPTAATRQPSVAGREKKAWQGMASWDGRGSNGITTSLPQAPPACAGWCYRANFTRTRCAFDACWGCAECPCKGGCYAHAHAGTPWSTKCGWEKGACWGCAGCRRNCTETECKNRRHSSVLHEE